MSGITLYKLKSILPDTLQRQPRYFIGISFGFFLKDEDFVSKTINEGSMDLDEFPTSRVCQLANKMKNSRATARHIKTSTKRKKTTQQAKASKPEEW